MMQGTSPLNPIFVSPYPLPSNSWGESSASACVNGAPEEQEEAQMQMSQNRMDEDEYADIASWIEQQLPPNITPGSDALADLLDALPELDRA